MEHTSPRKKYRVDAREGSLLTTEDRENIRRGIRSILARVRDEYDVDIDGVGALSTVRFWKDPQNGLTIEAHVLRDSVETDIRADDYADAEEEEDMQGYSDQQYLRDIGPSYEDLEAALIGELVVMLDLPEYQEELKKYVYFDSFGLQCTLANSLTATFTMTVKIPGVTQEMYDEDRFDIADMIGLPMLE